MKRVLFVGDVHGRDTWEKMVGDALSKFDHIVFLGDYVDSFDLQPFEIIENLKEILKLKKRYKDRITLLLGNHDYAYVFGKDKISGYRGDAAIDYKQVFNKNWDLFDLAWGYTDKNDNYTLVTHAGLTKEYFNELSAVSNDRDFPLFEIFKDLNIENLKIHEFLNYFKDQCSILWKVGAKRSMFGASGTGSILWCDKSELLDDPMPLIDQIVGHTHAHYIDIRQANSNKIYFVDGANGSHLAGIKIEFT